MRVCYLCADRGIPLDGYKGASAHVRGFVRALLALGHDVRVLTAAPMQAPPADLPIVPVPTPLIADALMESAPPRVARALAHTLTNVSVESALLDTVAHFRPDLVYERYSPFSAAGTLLSRRLGIAHVLEVNAPLAWEGNQYRGQAMADAAAAIEHAVFTSASLIVAVSSELRDWLIGAGVDGAKIVVVPNGVDTAVFHRFGERRRSLPDPMVVIGFAGSLKEWHGLDVLAAAFRELAADPRYHLNVIGDGPMMPLVRQLANDFPGRVTIPGAIAQEQVAEYLRGIDIAVAPYPASDHFYFSPLKVLEYMASGTAVIASDIGQLGTTIRNGVTGMLVPPGDVAALTTAIRQLAEQPERRRALGQAAATEIARSHTWQQRVTQVLQLVSAQRAGAIACSA